MSACQAQMTRISNSYPGTPASVPAARRWLRRYLAESPCIGPSVADDLELIASELMTNAIRHTPSGAAGGRFTLTVACGPGRARIEVVDQGPGLAPVSRGDELAECGRGLSLVRALATEVGHEPAPSGHLAYATLTW